MNGPWFFARIEVLWRAVEMKEHWSIAASTLSFADDWLGVIVGCKHEA